MPDAKPKHYEWLKDAHPRLVAAVEELGKAVSETGPLDDKTLQLVQLGAAVALRSEGAVMSHARRALAAGASREEVAWAIASLASTVGFPTVAAAMAWTKPLLA